MPGGLGRPLIRGRMGRQAVLLVALGGALAAGVGSAAAQTAGPTGTSSPLAEPALRMERRPLPEVHGPLDRDRSSRAPLWSPGPRFVAPMMVTIPLSVIGDVQLGVAGWTTPPLPLPIPQGDAPYAKGDPVIGFSILWGLPVAAEEPAPPPVKPAGR